MSDIQPLNIVIVLRVLNKSTGSVDEITIDPEKLLPGEIIPIVHRTGDKGDIQWEGGYRIKGRRMAVPRRGTAYIELDVVSEYVSGEFEKKPPKPKRQYPKHTLF